MATRIGFEPTISALTGQYVNHYTTGPQNTRDHRALNYCSQQASVLSNQVADLRQYRVQSTTPTDGYN